MLIHFIILNIVRRTSHDEIIKIEELTVRRTIYLKLKWNIFTDSF